MAVINNPSQKRAKTATTHYRISEKFANHTELIISLETGRTHQIRVHMSHIKKPLVGDKTYNSRYRSIAGISEELDNKLREFPRQALHAFSLSFLHPASKNTCEFHCEAPEDYKELINILRKEDLLMISNKRIEIIRPKWPAPTNIYCGSTLGKKVLVFHLMLV